MANVAPLPLFYQSLTDALFNGRIKLHCTISCPLEQVESEAKGEADGNALSFEEENAIRYAGGYFLRLLRKKACQQNKGSVVEAIDILVSNDEMDENDLSTSWTMIVDRGGLLHISDDLYRLFVAMELEIRRHLRVEKTSELFSSIEGKLVTFLLTNEDVQFTGASSAVTLKKR